MGLIAADADGSSDPYVRTVVERSVKQTEIAWKSVSPRWDAQPFLFHVSELATIVKVDVLDSDLLKDVSLGKLQFSVAEVPKSVNPPADLSWEGDQRLPAPSCYTLSGVSQGQLELEVMFFQCRAESSSGALRSNGEQSFA